MEIETRLCSWCDRERRVATKGHEAICADCAAVLDEACRTKMWPGAQPTEVFELQERLGDERRALRDPFSLAWLTDRLAEATVIALKTTGRAESNEVQRLRDELVERLRAGEPSPLDCALCATSPHPDHMTVGAALVACGPCLAEAHDDLQRSAPTVG